MTTDTVDLKHRLGEARMPCPNHSDGHCWTCGGGCKGDSNTVLRWPEFQQACPFVDLPDHTFCHLCDGVRIVPNVTLETMMAALMRLYMDVSFSADKGEWCDACSEPRTIWVNVRQLDPPYYESDHMGGDSHGVDAEAALMAALGAWLDKLEATGGLQ